MTLKYLRRLTLLQDVDYNQILQKFHMLLQLIDQHMSQIDESLTNLDLKASPPNEGCKFC